jgi:hypothetical protein
MSIIKHPYSTLKVIRVRKLRKRTGEYIVSRNYNPFCSVCHKFKDFVFDYLIINYKKGYKEKNHVHLCSEVCLNIEILKYIYTNV